MQCSAHADACGPCNPASEHVADLQLQQCEGWQEQYGSFSSVLIKSSGFMAVCIDTLPALTPFLVGDGEGEATARGRTCLVGQPHE